MASPTVVLLLLPLLLSPGAAASRPFSVSAAAPQVAPAFAAKNRSGSGKRRKQASTTKGFGSPPPTFAEVVEGFKTRLPPPAELEAAPCPCGSQVVYADCCRPYHTGSALPSSPSVVLRTRYSAFSYRIVPYIIETTHRECRDWGEDKVAWAKDLDKTGMFDSYDFVELQAGPEEVSADKPDEGYVDFKVRMKARDGQNSLEGKETVVSERSRFILDGNPSMWRYAGGNVKSDIEGLDDLVLNK